MSAVNVNALYPIFTDIDGQPLEDGYVWIGVTGLEPQANPQTAYWDAALTLTATQPVRTRGGYPLNGTAIGRLFTAAPYSIKVQNKRTSTIATDLSASSGTGVGSISFGSTGLTPAVATDGDVVVAGTLAVANGGTGVTTATGTGSVVRATSPTITGPTVSSGNLAFSGTAQRITGDFSNATVGNLLLFQTSTVNGNTSVAAIPNGTSVQSNLRAFNNSDPTNASFADIGVDTTIGAFVRADRTGTGTYTPLTFNTGGSERVRVDTSGNVGIGTASPGERLNVSTGGAEYAIQWNSTGSNNWVLASATNRAYIANKSTSAEVLTILNGGNVGIGTASPASKFDVYAVSGTVTGYIRSAGATGTDIANFYTLAGSTSVQSVAYGNGFGYLLAVASSSFTVGNSSNAPLIFTTNNTERLRIDSSGNVVQGTAAVATTATAGFLWITSCAGIPTGAPTAPYTNAAALVCDTTNNRLYVRVAGTWRYATLT